MYTLEELTIINKALEIYLKHKQKQNKSTNDQINAIKMLIWKIESAQEEQKKYKQAIQTFDEMFWTTEYGRRQQKRRR